jgi:hypothetical protein
MVMLDLLRKENPLSIASSHGPVIMAGLEIRIYYNYITLKKGIEIRQLRSIKGSSSDC